MIFILACGVVALALLAFMAWDASRPNRHPAEAGLRAWADEMGVGYMTAAELDDTVAMARQWSEIERLPEVER